MRLTESDIETVLKEEDIEGLLELGAPSDEYSAEAQSIMAVLRSMSESDLSEDRVAAIVRAVWTTSFGPFSAEDIQKRLHAFRKVAHRICAA
jgi:hypothetical protein